LKIGGWEGSDEFKEGLNFKIFMIQKVEPYWQVAKWKCYAAGNLNKVKVVRYCMLKFVKRT
jgi:hypothetical protein